MNERSSGILLHVTSLPSPFGIGDMGPCAYEFADFLAEAGQSVWQILPLNPPIEGHYSPYLGPSAFAGNPLLISPELLIRDGLIPEEEIAAVPSYSSNRVEFERVVPAKRRLLERAYQSFRTKQDRHGYNSFCAENKHWLDDFALFTVLQTSHESRVWQDWPPELRDRNPDALATAAGALEDDIVREKFFQYLFHAQWQSLRAYCNDRGIKIFGDIPIYIDFNSADVWTHPELFKLDETKRPVAVSGVPPDYFSKTGQLWGHPVYRWDALKAAGYQWWMDRISHNLKLCDLVRIDHFRGFVAYWEVPAGEATAINGKWVKGPGRDFFKTVIDRFRELPIVAEDLGIITEDVEEVIRELDLPGMKVLLFAFGDDTATNPYVPHNLVRNCIAYTGTHDNNTVRGWIEQEASKEDKERLFTYLGREVAPEQLHWDLIRLLMMSVANTVVFPMQDVLGLGAEDRMNTPSTTDGNWGWRLNPDLVVPAIKEKLLSMTKTYGRQPRTDAPDSR